MSRDTIKISKHAIERYQERIAHVGNEIALQAILSAIHVAKDKHVAARRINKNTFYIPSEGVILVGSRGTIVTVIKDYREKEPKLECEGFTRPDCRPCLKPDVDAVMYLCMGVEETRMLCEQCASRILTGDPIAWG